jgi:hypothetical protein
MAKQLTHLVLEELSLVDDGANDYSRVLIAKRKPAEPEIDPKTGKPKVKPVSTLGSPTSSNVITGDPATSSPNPGADAGAGVSKIRLAMLQHLPEFADQLIAKALAASPAADPNAAALAAASITEIFMDLAQLSAALEAAEADNVVQKARATAAEARNKELETTITKMKGEHEELITKARGVALQTPEQQEEEFMKGLPASVRDRLLADRAATKIALESVEKMREAGDLTEAIAKAKTIGAPEPDKAGPLLMRVAKGKTTAEDATLLETILKAAGAQAAAGGLFKTAGVPPSGAADMGDPEAALNGKATEIAKARNISHAKAYEAAMTENPELYDQYIAKRRG